MALYFYKKPIIASATALATLLQKYQCYGANLEYPENEEELYEKALANVTLLSSAISRIRTAVETIQERVDKIENHYANAKKTDQKELIIEVQEIERESQYPQHLASAEAFIHILEAQLTEAKVNLAKAQRKLKLPTANNDSEGSSTHNSNQTTWSQGNSEEPNSESTSRMWSIKPPNINLPKFYGSEEEFPEYWAVYDSLIHSSNDLSTIEKIVLLKDSLRGKAERAIKGIQPIAKNYEWIVQTLKDKFGNRPVNRSKIIQKLFDLKAAAHNAKSCDDCLDSIKALVNQMVSTDYDIRATSEPMWTETIIKKFPYTIIKDVLAKYQDDKNITIGNLITLLEREISSKLFVETHWGSESEQTREIRYTDDSGKQSQRFPRNCAFCGRNNHHSALCRTVTDIQRKRAIAKENRLCWICFNGDHSSNQCNKPNCSCCGQKHHHSICLASRPFGTNVRAPPASPWPARNEANQQNCGSRPQQSDSRPSSRYCNDDRRTQQTNTQVIQIEQDYDRSKIDTSKNEQLILMTAEGNLWNNKNKRFEKVLFFFDTGAHKTMIEEKLANNFGLPKLFTETCTMSGIGGHVERFDSTTVPLRVRSAYGKELRFNVQTKPIVTKGFPSVRLTEEDANFLEHNQICVANSSLQGERQVPKILVGLDRYHDLVIEDGVPQRTPSGLRIAKTVFGPTVYGRGRLDNPAEHQQVIASTSVTRRLQGAGLSTTLCSFDLAHR
ncbi:hypothetical protein V3C99_004717 [Haemonchus contortus]|uniref:Peptidase A2 domain-containing protein n=1 Tax=Haemonchus contortus TaxID=6289 RepID=A0A7I4XVP3_HAECO